MQEAQDPNVLVISVEGSNEQQQLVEFLRGHDRSPKTDDGLVIVPDVGVDIASLVPGSRVVRLYTAVRSAPIVPERA
jgi:hypothetical protein